jgi:hypothetical protein
MCPIFAQVAGRTVLRLVSASAVRIALSALLTGPPPVIVLRGMIDRLAEQFETKTFSPGRADGHQAAACDQQALTPDCVGPGMGWG